MIRLKNIAKTLLGIFYCILFRVKYHKGIYIGLGAKIVGGGKILLQNNVKVMPHSMIVSLGIGVIEIGEYSEISMFSRVASVGHVKIGRYVLFGPNVFIADYNHRYTDPFRPIMFQGNNYTPTQNGEPNLSIGDGTWIGTNVVIIGNVHIGKNCVIGANSVISKDIPDRCVAVGTPARIVKRYDIENNTWEKLKI